MYYVDGEPPSLLKAETKKEHPDRCSNRIRGPGRTWHVAAREVTFRSASLGRLAALTSAALHTLRTAALAYCSIGLLCIITII